MPIKSPTATVRFSGRLKVLNESLNLPEFLDAEEVIK